jgi:hypothetical protein
MTASMASLIIAEFEADLEFSQLWDRHQHAIGTARHGAILFLSVTDTLCR